MPIFSSQNPYEHLDKAALVALVMKRDATIKAQHEDLINAREQISKINRLLGLRNKKLFGSSSEKQGRGAVTEDLDKEGLKDQQAGEEKVAGGEGNEAASKESKKRRYLNGHPGRSAFSADMPRVVEHFYPEGYDPSWNRELEPEITERIVLTINSFIKVDIRHKFARGNRIVIAPCRLEDPFYKYKATTELVCNMMNLRFGLHVPYYRFLQLLPGCNLSYSTLIGWAARAFEILAPLKPLLAGEITKEAKLVCMDETTFKLLDTPARIAAFKASHKSQRNLSIEGGRDSGSQASMDLEEDEDMEAEVATGVARRKVVLRGQMWTLLNPAAGLVMFEYSPSRATSNATAMLSGYKGLLMSDACTAYKRLAKLSGNDITRLSCWVHARRKIVEAQDLKSRDPVAKEIIKRIGALYKIEKTIKGLAPRRKKKVRKRSTRLLKSLKKYMERKIVEYAPREAVRTAIQYCLNNWQELSQYPHHKNGIVDNNVTERAIRPLTVARKNILFLGSVDHAPGAALLYSLVECCKLQKIDPHAWLLDVMNRIEYYPKDQLTDLLPHKWKKVADNPKAQS